MLKCIELDERLKAMDQEITVNPQFVQKVIGPPSLTEICWRELGGVPVIVKFTETCSWRAFPQSRLEVCLGVGVGVLELPPSYTG